MKPVFTNEELEKQAKKDNQNNLKCLKTWASPFIIVGIVVLIGTGISTVKNKSWSRAHTIGLGLVLSCFITEVIYFFSIFRSYEVIGDWEIIEKAFQHVLSQT